MLPFCVVLLLLEFTFHLRRIYNINPTYMRRLLPKVWCIAMCSISICGYSRDLTFYESASESSHKVAFFQSETITGKVLDEAGLGMPGVNVIVKGTSVGTTTDAEGAYRLSVTKSRLPASLYFHLSVMQLRNNQSITVQASIFRWLRTSPNLLKLL